MNSFHTPVLKKEAADFLAVENGEKYIDATLGGGGHTFEILKRGGIVLGLDTDDEAIDYVRKKTEFRIDKELFLAKGNFRDIEEIARLYGFDQVAGVIFDLGVSGYQIDNPQRGFSFQKPGPLDMRMDKSIRTTAADLVNTLSQKELYEIFSKLGEEPRARAISNIIVSARGVKRLETTADLSAVVEKAYGFENKKVSPFIRSQIASRVFQALRIAVNDELNNLAHGLYGSLKVLKEGGRVGVITFHSIEDRMVKHTFADFQREGLGRVLTKKPIRPDEEEIRENRRSRSAKMRFFEKK